MPLMKSISATEGDILGCYHDQVGIVDSKLAGYLYMFTAAAKLVIMDDRYLHMAKRIHLGNYELTSVEQLDTRSFLLGTNNGSVEYIKILVGEDFTINSQLYFFSKVRIAAIRHYKSLSTHEVYFAVRTEQNHLFVARLSHSNPLMLLNIDCHTVDVNLDLASIV